MFRLTLILCAVVVLLVSTSMVMGQGLPQSKGKDVKNNKLALDTLLKKVERRYAGPGFSAEFEQQSTISAMEITDSASGKLYVKRPGKMRWEYVLPETQIIISDSNDLWIYRPEDNQVLVGKAPSFFSHGKGATLLSDITNVRKAFIVTLEHKDKDGNPVLKLIPKQKSAEVTEIHITISKQADTIDQILTKNGYEDETRIQINKYRFNQDLAEKLFVFEIPNGADVLQLDQQ
jgi:outer membrane lipoprotein carrier protein